MLVGVAKHAYLTVMAATRLSLRCEYTGDHDPGSDENVIHRKHLTTTAYNSAVLECRVPCVLESTGDQIQLSFNINAMIYSKCKRFGLMSMCGSRSDGLS